MMRIAYLCKRQYMSKDVILDRYARLYEIPYQLAKLGHEVRAFCLDYHDQSEGTWRHDAFPGTLTWESQSLGRLKLPALAAYPWRLLRKLQEFDPALLFGASDIPHVALTRWLACRLRKPYAVDLYDNFEGFGQARIPGFKSALRRGTRDAALITTTSTPLLRLVVDQWNASGKAISMPSSVDLSVFRKMDKQRARELLGLPKGSKLIGTAGGLYRDKGIAPLYTAWEQISRVRQDVHLVLAGPVEKDLPPPTGERVHYLGQLPHDQVAVLFNALDIGVISVLDTPFGRYCFPQKAYEMLACGLTVVAADVGAMAELFSSAPSLLFAPNDATALAISVIEQLENPIVMELPIKDWTQLVRELELLLPGR